MRCLERRAARRDVRLRQSHFSKRNHTLKYSPLRSGELFSPDIDMACMVGMSSAVCDRANCFTAPPATVFNDRVQRPNRRRRLCMPHRCTSTLRRVESWVGVCCSSSQIDTDFTNTFAYSMVHLRLGDSSHSTESSIFGRLCPPPTEPKAGTEMSEKPHAQSQCPTAATAALQPLQIQTPAFSAASARSVVGRCCFVEWRKLSVSSAASRRSERF
jgi:hypothetical protein